METGALICLIICLVMSLAVLLLILSMGSLEPLEYGITYNKITKTIGSTVFENGRYIIGPWMSFIVYPANLVTVEFSDARRATVNTFRLYLHLINILVKCFTNKNSGRSLLSPTRLLSI